MSYLGNIVANSGVEVRARLEGFGSRYMQQSQVDVMRVAVFDERTWEPMGDSFTVRPAEGISNTLLAWEEDEVGYNVAVKVPATYFPDGRIYRVELALSPAAGIDGDRVLVIWKLEAEGSLMGD